MPSPSPEDLPNPGIEPGSPALQADSLSSELQGRYDFLIFRVVLLLVRGHSNLQGPSVESEPGIMQVCLPDA